MNLNVNVNVSFDDKTNSSQSKNVKELSKIEIMKLRHKHDKYEYEYNTKYKKEYAISDDTPIYRYMSYYKLKNLLEESKLYFSNTKTNTDNRERQIPDQCYKGYLQDAKEYASRTNNAIQEVVQSYLSCWTIAGDSYALWKLYDSSVDGCRICTTFGELKKQMENKNVAFFKVQYIDLHSDKRVSLPPIMFESGSAPGSIRGSERYKIEPYKYEEEIRGVIYSKEDCDGILVDVDIRTLIKKVMLNPFATDEAHEKVQQLLQKHLPNAEYEKSDIDEKVKRSE